MNQNGWPYLTAGQAKEEAAGVSTDLLDGVIHGSTTILYGPSGVGKGRLLAELITAGLDGRPFLGREWLRPVERVAIIGTDAGAGREYGRFLDRSGLPFEHEDSVRIYQVEHPPSISEWDEITGSISGWKPSLVILDSATEAVRGSVNDDVAARDLIASMRAFHGSEGRVPLVLVHHTAKPGPDSGGRRGRSPIGSMAWEAMSRSKIYVREGFAADDADVTLEIRPRESAAWECHLRVAEDGRLIFDHATTGDDVSARKVARKDATIEQNMAAAKWAQQNCAGLTKSQTADRLVQKFPTLHQGKNHASAAKSTISKGERYAAMLTWDDAGKLLPH